MIIKGLKYNRKPALKLNPLQLQMKKQIEEKLEAGHYSFEEAKCIICQDPASELFGEKDRYGLYYPVRICKGCGLIYTSPRMTQRSYAEFYNEEYRKLYVGSEKPTVDFFERQYLKGKAIYEYLQTNKLVNNTPLFVFEVGCGAGGILQFFRAKNHETMGIDLGNEYVRFGRDTHGLDLRTSTLAETIDTLPKKPDIIIYSHVMEHLSDPKKELEMVRQLSHEKTVLYIEVPGVKYLHQNYRKNILRYLQNAHTYHFSLTTLNNLLHNEGFTLICGNEFVRSAFKLSPLDASFAPVNDFLPVMKYLRRMEKEKPFYDITRKISRVKVGLLTIIVKALEMTGLKEPLKALIKK